MKTVKNKEIKNPHTVVCNKRNVCGIQWCGAGYPHTPADAGEGLGKCHTYSRYCFETETEGVRCIPVEDV